MSLRHELKHRISSVDLFCIRSQLKAVMTADKHSVNGHYFIRSLYFDDMFDTALREKINGVSRREKFRLRYYNGDTNYILLEKKSKINGLCEKSQVRITKEDASALICGNTDAVNCDKPLMQEFIIKMQTKGLKAKTIVDYTREPFVYAPGNVRVTLDYDIRTALSCTDFLNTNCVTVPVSDFPIIMEVKWDEFLPNLIRDIVQLEGRHTSAFSKYAACRAIDF